MALNSFRKQFTDIEDACALAQAIVDTVREPVLVFDKDLRVIAASRSPASRCIFAPALTGASVDPSMRSFANGICIKLTTERTKKPCR